MDLVLQLLCWLLFLVLVVLSLVADLEEEWTSVGALVVCYSNPCLIVSLLVGPYVLSSGLLMFYVLLVSWSVVVYVPLVVCIFDFSFRSKKIY